MSKRYGINLGLLGPDESVKEWLAKFGIDEFKNTSDPNIPDNYINYDIVTDDLSKLRRMLHNYDKQSEPDFDDDKDYGEPEPNQWWDEDIVEFDDEEGYSPEESDKIENKEKLQYTDDDDDPHDEDLYNESERILNKVVADVADDIVDGHIDKTRKNGASFIPRSKTGVKAMLEANKKGVKLSDENTKNVKDCVSDRTMKNIIGTLSQYRW